MKSLFACGLLCLLAACAPPPFTKQMTPYPQAQPEERQAFFAALDRYAASQQSDRLDAFSQQFPDSGYRSYAAAIRRAAVLLEQRNRQLQQRELELRQLQQEQQQLQEQFAAAQQENRLLNEKIEQLKKLLIELEQRPQ